MASGVHGEDGAWISDADTQRWQLHLLLPAGVTPDVIPQDLQIMLASLLDAVLRRHSAAPAQEQPAHMTWRVAAREGRLGPAPGYWRDLQPILERFWGTSVRLELVASDVLPRIAIQRARPAVERPRPDQPAGSVSGRSGRVVAFTPDIDSLAAVSRILEAQQEPPVLVVYDEIAGYRAMSPESLTQLLEACRSRVATIEVQGPRRRGHRGGAAPIPCPEDWRLLHMLAAVCVAIACGADEIQVPQNGIANLNLPVTAAMISRPAHPIDPQLTSGFGSLLSRIAGADIRLRNPLLADTPSELVAALIGRGPGRLALDIHALCGLVENGNSYEKRVDHHVSILGALPAGSALTEQYELMLMSELLVPLNQGLADTYVRAIRELPAMSDRDMISHLDESGARVATSRDRHALVVGLLRRHAESVRHVLARAMQRYAHEIVAGTLASTCLLMRATLPGDVRPGASPRKPVFRKLGRAPDCWEIWFEAGEPLYLKTSKGLDYIHVLLQSPGRTFSPVELRDAIAGHGRLPTGTLGPVSDVQAIRDYQHRLTELRADLDTATENNDIGRTERILYEIEALEQEISRCVGLGGRLRHNSDAERARKSVSNAIYRALHQLRPRHAVLFRHLSAALKIGNGVCYIPTDPTEWDT
jgi:hypothetical protein